MPWPQLYPPPVAPPDTAHVPMANHPSRFRHGVVGLEQRLAHGIRNRSRDEQQIGKSRRWSKENSQPMKVVIRIVQRLQFRLAPVAGTSVHMTDMQAAPKASLDILFELLSWLRSQRFDPHQIFASLHTKGPVVRFDQGFCWARFGTKLAPDTLPVVDGEPLARSFLPRSDRSGKANLGAGTAILLTLIRLETGQAKHSRLDVCISALRPWIGCDSLPDTK